MTCNIGYWNFENNRSINRLFGESAQHYTISVSFIEFHRKVCVYDEIFDKVLRMYVRKKSY